MSLQDPKVFWEISRTRFSFCSFVLRTKPKASCMYAKYALCQCLFFNLDGWWHVRADLYLSQENKTFNGVAEYFKSYWKDWRKKKELSIHRGNQYFVLLPKDYVIYVPSTLCQLLVTFSGGCPRSPSISAEQNHTHTCWRLGTQAPELIRNEGECFKCLHKWNQM